MGTLVKVLELRQKFQHTSGHTSYFRHLKDLVFHTPVKVSYDMQGESRNMYELLQRDNVFTCKITSKTSLRKGEKYTVSVPLVTCFRKFRKVTNGTETVYF